jgi:hypothetical protein
MIGLAALAFLAATLPAAPTISDAPALRHADVKRTSFPPAEAVLPVAARDGVIIQRLDSLTFLPMHGDAVESRLASDSSFASGRIVRAFVVGSSLYVAIDPLPGTDIHPLLYDVDRHRRIALEPLDGSATNGKPHIETLLVGPNGDAAIVEIRSDGKRQSFWVRFRDGAVKAIPSWWENREEFAGEGKWACFIEDTSDSNNNDWSRAVVMATGELLRPALPEPAKPTKEDPLVVYISMGPVLDLGPEQPTKARDVSLPPISVIYEDKFRGLRIGKRVAVLPQLSPDTAPDPRLFAVAGEWAAVMDRKLVVTSLQPGAPLHTIADTPADWLLFGGGHVLLRTLDDRLILVDAGKDQAWPLDLGMHPPTVEKAGRLPLSYGSPKTHFYGSFGSKDKRSIAMVDLPLAISESKLTHMQYGIERFHVQPHTLLIDSSGRRFEIDVAIPPDAKVYVHESGTIVLATPQTLERITVRFPK